MNGKNKIRSQENDCPPVRPLSVAVHPILRWREKSSKHLRIGLGNRCDLQRKYRISRDLSENRAGI